ncbi:Uncharacterised protein (plasmid) [Tsukamurella tyrosinosolvens]|uniref:Uncharacterized protein n=1 Tax=Tsukamurella tyrosinosolvens TaxID=57704 RepID=A0A1H4VQ56_TSUTY|nr:hypothetical protein [Tsukamurella tyrosinosolvens]KXO90929.1 hypothetical protein AXK58_21075 [Tsukamurella tyrosinosolvens]SEC82561.1 hypothetical protein SAMN04489793_3285 [Tsukamurella tyrosinosolvens]VEH90403.1 Uncharacterised protein [Tsukamurella tyrosinosolvens]
MSAQDRLAAIAADHAPDQLSPDDGYSWVDGCTCGWMGTESPNWDAQEWADMDAPEYRTYRLWAEHLAAVIDGAGDIAVIELPKPEPDVDRPTFDAGCGAIAHAEPDGDVRLHSVAWIAGRYGGMFRSPRAAVHLAAALLAAAKAAEAVSD